MYLEAPHQAVCVVCEMLKWLQWLSMVRAEVLLVVLLAVGGLACADTLDLSDDLALPLAGFQQAVQPDLLDDFSEILKPVQMQSVPGSHDLDMPRSLLRPLSRMFQTLLHLSDRPVYQAICVYRI